MALNIRIILPEGIACNPALHSRLELTEVDFFVTVASVGESFSFLFLPAGVDGVGVGVGAGVSK